MPRTVWDQVGEMDTRYEIGMFEDDDLSLRVRQAGFGIWAAEDCFIHHFGQGSFSKLPSETYNRIFEANRKRFEEKWKHPWVAHHTRPGVRPPWEEKRFTPAEFFPGPPPPRLESAFYLGSQIYLPAYRCSRVCLPPTPAPRHWRRPPPGRIWELITMLPSAPM